MIRRLGTALMGLALTLPLTALPVAAHTTGGLTVVFATYDVGTVTHVVGTVTNHTGSRVRDVTVTATWTAAPASVESGLASVSFLAPHSSSPFHLVEDDLDVTGAPTVAATSATTALLPSGGLQINEVAPTGTTTIVATGTVKNEATVTANAVVVYGVLRDGSGTILDTDTSASVGNVAAGATSAGYTLTFENGTGGVTVDTYAQSTTGTAYLTHWTNYFSDLGTSSFTNEIAFLADEGITLGCSQAKFCPAGVVTREQMALFLDRAIVFANEAAPDQGFTDIGSLSAAAQQSINNLALAGVTGGCSVTPKKYCPTQTVTRGQMSKFIVTGYAIPAATGSFVNSFTDDNGHFSETYNDAMKQAAITSGCGATLYCPNANVTREQMAKFLYEAETP